MQNSPQTKLAEIRHYAEISLCFLVSITAMCGAFVYLVSPLRDPVFVPNSANAGSSLNGVSESDWLFGAKILAAMLSTNLTLLGVVHWLGHHPLIDVFQSRIRIKRILPEIFIWSIVWIFLFGVLWFVFLIYLLSQWLVD